MRPLTTFHAFRLRNATADEHHYRDLWKPDGLFSWWALFGSEKVAVAHATAYLREIETKIRALVAARKRMDTAPVIPEASYAATNNLNRHVEWIEWGVKSFDIERMSECRDLLKHPCRPLTMYVRLLRRKCHQEAIQKATVLPSGAHEITYCLGPRTPWSPWTESMDNGHGVPERVVIEIVPQDVTIAGSLRMARR